MDYLQQQYWEAHHSSQSETPTGLCNCPTVLSACSSCRRAKIHDDNKELVQGHVRPPGEFVVSLSTLLTLHLELTSLLSQPHPIMKIRTRRNRLKCIAGVTRQCLSSTPPTSCLGGREFASWLRRNEVVNIWQGFNWLLRTNLFNASLQSCIQENYTCMPTSSML